MICSPLMLVTAFAHPLENARTERNSDVQVSIRHPDEDAYSQYLSGCNHVELSYRETFSWYVYPTYSMTMFSEHLNIDWLQSGIWRAIRWEELYAILRLLTINSKPYLSWLWHEFLWHMDLLMILNHDESALKILIFNPSTTWQHCARTHCNCEID